MRKTEDGPSAPYGRLSSSCSSIRSSNYTPPRNYTSSLSTYKYSPAAYTPNSRMSAESSSISSTRSPLPSRSRFSTTTSSSSAYSTPSTNLSRAASASHKTLYSSPAAARVSVSAMDSIGSNAAPYRGISRYSSSVEPKPYSGTSSYERSSTRGRAEKVEAEKIELGPTTRTNMVHPTSSHIRSRSSSYRTISVSQFTQQARERADRDEKDRQYKEWIEREKDRENELGVDLMPYTSSSTNSNQTVVPALNDRSANTAAQTDFRKQMSSSFRSTPSTRYSSKTLGPATTSSSTYSTTNPMTSSTTDENLLMSTSYSGTAPSSAPPPSYSSSSSYLRTRKSSQLPEKPEKENYVRENGVNDTTSPIPPPPPPPPAGGIGQIPRSMSAAVISSSASSYSIKPTAKVYPYDDDHEKGCVVPTGFTGLRNIGNTCFMNAILQMLVNNVELKEYFLKSHYKMEINENNPLGSEGRLARAFADFMKQMWSGMHKAIEPLRIKEIVAEKASQFANFAQHDAHEFLSFLLDGLHEDVNRVKKKPTTGTVESDGRHDNDVSNEAWRNHILRNDSIFVDLFHGQLKSHVQCPNCDRISITFDPFVYLPVPFPKRKKTSNIIFWPLDTQAKPIKVTVSYSTEGTISDLLSAVGGAVRVPSRNLRAIEVFGHRIDKVLSSEQKAADIGTADVIYVFQVHDESDCNEEVVILYALQRQMYPNNLRYMCNGCGSNDGKLKACDACYNAYYCSKDCQLSNWSSGGHREECKRRPISEVVGQPLVVSFPKSQLTYPHLYRVLEAKSRHTVTIFQQPQYDPNEVAEKADSDTMTVPTLVVKKRSGVGAPPSFLAAADPSPLEQSSSSSSIGRGSSPRRQSVLAEPRSKNQKMFDIRKLNSPNDSFGESIHDPETLVEKVKNGSYICLNWINLRFGKEYITVGNRSELDIDVEKSRLLCSKSRSSIERSNNTETHPHLTQMLDLFSETERLKPEESWYCSACKEHVEATKRLQLYRLPPVLIIQLKRFVYTAFTHQSSMHRRSKDERKVEYPMESLDMKPFLADTAPSNLSTMYDLTGVVCHSGSSYFGHYISMGRLADFDSAKTKIEWRQFDDSMVTRQSVGNVQTDDAYLLFYKLRDPNVTRSIFKKHYSCDPGENSESTPDKDY